MFRNHTFTSDSTIVVGVYIKVGKDYCFGGFFRLSTFNNTGLILRTSTHSKHLKSLTSSSFCMSSSVKASSALKPLFGSDRADLT